MGENNLRCSSSDISLGYDTHDLHVKSFHYPNSGKECFDILFLSSKTTHRCTTKKSDGIVQHSMTNNIIVVQLGEVGCYTGAHWWNLQVRVSLHPLYIS